MMRRVDFFGTKVFFIMQINHNKHILYVSIIYENYD